MRKPIDIIVPVYNGLDHVKACLASVLGNGCETPHHLVVIDDASPDPSIAGYLERFAGDERVTCLTNPVNLGFTKTVNLGMRLNVDRDVLLLNSDTIVYGDWLNRMVKAADAFADVATVNPMTNANGSHISCYPRYSPYEAVGLEVDDAALDLFCATENIGRSAFVHCTVGFCMLIKRACLDEIGSFDDVNFPIGYGEETDFCYRARRMGWRHLVTGHVFVTHAEGKSFGDKKRSMVDNMLKRFHVLHPEAPQLDRRFRAGEPLRHLREPIDLARMARLLAGGRDLQVVAAPGQGADNGRPTLFFDRSTRTLRFDPSDGLFPNLVPYRLGADVARINRDMRRLGIDRWLCTSEEIARAICEFCRALPMEIGLEVRVQGRDTVRAG